MGERYKAVKKASILGIIGNIILLCLKGSISLVTGSQAMIADSINSAGDIFSSLMTYIGNKIASKPQDNCHNLGHGKAEYIFSLLIAISMILASFKSIINSVKSLIFHENYKFSYFLVIVCIITILTKFGLFIYTRKLAKKHNNILIEANSKDHRNDCFVTLCTLISALLGCKNILWFDGVVGIGISVWICITGINIFKESYDVLMDKAINETDKQKVLDIINSRSEIIRVERFNSIPVGYRYQISFTICVDGNLSTFESHRIANDLEKEISEKIEEVYLTIIHVHPV